MLKEAGQQGQSLAPDLCMCCGGAPRASTTADIKARLRSAVSACTYLCTHGASGTAHGSVTDYSLGTQQGGVALQHELKGRLCGR